jgi:hypothetical protein
MSRQAARFKAAIHPWIDPALSLPNHWRARRALAKLADGEYRAGGEVPYYSQFASPERIYDYIHHGYNGTRDPNWRLFGADDPTDYAFWAPRACALACIKMAVEAFHPDVQPSLWQLVKDGLAVNGYTVRDAHGNWIDEGWYYHAQAHLASKYGLAVVGKSYVSPLSVCRYIRDGWLVAASVTPEIGERQPSGSRCGGHLVLVYGFTWAGGRPTHFYLHNPSGRYTELQAGARIPAVRFHAAFARRLVAMRAHA